MLFRKVQTQSVANRFERNICLCFINEQNDAVSITHSRFTISSKSESVKKLLRPESKKQHLTLGIRPEDIRVHHQKIADDCIAAEIYVVEPLGNLTVVDIKLGDNIIKILADADFTGSSGQNVWITLRLDRLHFFDEESGQCLLHSSEGGDFQIAPL